MSLNDDFLLRPLTTSDLSTLDLQKLKRISPLQAPSSSNHPLCPLKHPLRPFDPNNFGACPVESVKGKKTAQIRRGSGQCYTSRSKVAANSVNSSPPPLKDVRGAWAGHQVALSLSGGKVRDALPIFPVISKSLLKTIMMLI